VQNVVVELVEAGVEEVWRMVETCITIAGRAGAAVKGRGRKATRMLMPIGLQVELLHAATLWHQRRVDQGGGDENER